MNTHAPLAFLIATFSLTSACHFADVAALDEHMTRECFLVPLGPTCSLAPDREEANRAVFERFAARGVTRAETEDCILAVDCSDERMNEDTDGAIDELIACMNADPGAVAIADRLAQLDERCVNSCETELMQCGDLECSASTVNGCFDGHDACLNACPSADVAP